MSTEAERAAFEAWADTKEIPAVHWGREMLWAAWQARAALAADRAQPEPVARGDDSRILHELAGAASLCWEPKPAGVFDTSKAIRFVEAALKELRESCAASTPPAQPTQAEPVAGVALLKDEEIEEACRQHIRDMTDARPEGTWGTSILFARIIERLAISRMNAAQPTQAEPDTVPWPVVTRYSGGASQEGIGGRVWVRLADDGAEVEYMPAAQPTISKLPPRKFPDDEAQPAHLTDEEIDKQWRRLCDSKSYPLTRDLIRAFARLVRAAQPTQAEPATEPDNTLVICPECCSQFRAIPVQVQDLLLDAGYAPPFMTSARANAWPTLALTHDEIAAAAKSCGAWPALSHSPEMMTAFARAIERLARGEVES